MNTTETHRFELLKSGRADTDYLSDYYGLTNLAANTDLIADLTSFCVAFVKPARFAPVFEDRYVLERFFQTKKLVPKKWFAAQLGLKAEIMDTILERLDQLPVPIRTSQVQYGCLVNAELEDAIIASIPEFRFRTFGDHESYCLRMQAALVDKLHLDAAVVLAGRLWCATSDEMQSYPRRFGKWFDCLTCQPLSVQHQVWLDFRKPLQLAPDRCSKLFYARNRDELEAFVAGSEPTDLDEYLNFVPPVEQHG